MHTHRHWSDLSGADLPQTGFYELVTHPTIFVAKPVPGPSQAKTTADESTHLPCSQLPCGEDSSSSSWILTNPEFVDFFQDRL